MESGVDTFFRIQFFTAGVTNVDLNMVFTMEVLESWDPCYPILSLHDAGAPFRRHGFCRTPFSAPLLTRVVSVLNMSDQIVSCVHSKPSAQFSTDVVVIPRVSADYVSVENNTQKRMIREELVSSQVYCPDVKRPRFRNHASFISCSEVRIYRCQDADVKEVEPRIINDFITKTCLSEISIKAKSFEKKNVSVLVYSNPSTAYTE
ncbi:hypothetical protein RB195_022501 [Necator americanus]|uniref:Uncharacterized protein n=1 Tax=Necator americanus TaxID=51031 RepID=A0ABR1EFU0_NECAM